MEWQTRWQAAGMPGDATRQRKSAILKREYKKACCPPPRYVEELVRQFGMPVSGETTASNVAEVPLARTSPY